MRFDLNQFRAQLDQIDVDSIHDLMFKIPCSGQMGTDDLVLDVQSKLKQLKGVIDSMTSAERRDPGLIELSRRRRIAEGTRRRPNRGFDPEPAIRPDGGAYQSVAIVTQRFTAM